MAPGLTGSRSSCTQAVQPYSLIPIEQELLPRHSWRPAGGWGCWAEETYGYLPVCLEGVSGVAGILLSLTADVESS